MKIAVQNEDFDLNFELARMRESRQDIGALVSFVGLVRDLNDGETVSQLTLEHYPGMTEKALQAIVADASSRWAVLDATVLHREFIMDYLKTQAPFWKKELTASGERWLDDKDSDHDAQKRWQLP
jgi:molybdopterin synthase catalytic subunit